MPKTPLQSVCILGATGSIGSQSIEVLLEHRKSENIELLSVHSQWRKLLHLLPYTKPKYLAVTHQSAISPCQLLVRRLGLPTKILTTVDEIAHVCTQPHISHIIAATSGISLLPLYTKLVEKGKRLLLANKESVIVGGSHFLQAAKNGGGQIIPIDSEPHAIYQCIDKEYWHKNYSCPPDVASITLTASGGPFVDHSTDALKRVSVHASLNHPTWSMGPKISVDSATMMNKGFEMIESARLFDIPESNIDAVVHRKSMVHGMVHFIDGSMLMQAAYPSMKIPISYGLFLSRKLQKTNKPISFGEFKNLQFEPIRHDSFPALLQARQAIRAGDYATIMLCAVNDSMVQQFLEGKIPFTTIGQVCENCLQRQSPVAISGIDDAMQFYHEASRLALEELRK